MFRIEMFESGSWVRLGGIYPGNVVAKRIGQFQLCYMGRLFSGLRNWRSTQVTCKRVFRIVAV
jgi:hypothetical protein